MEVGYTDFGRIKASGGDVNAWAVPVSLTAGTPLGARFGVFGKVGGLYGRTDVTASLESLIETGDKSGWGWTYGAGATFAITPALQLRADWDRHKLDFAGGREDVDMLSAGLQARF
jgi:opacity protein-like surface antigen